MPKQLLSVEAYGCVVNKDEPEFLELVNRAVRSFRENTLNETSSSYNQWVFDQTSGVLYPLGLFKEGLRIWSIRENSTETK